MSHPDHRAGDSHFSKWMKEIAPLEDNLDVVHLSAARLRATEEAGAAIARQLNGPLTALLLYMNEIKKHSHQFSQAPGNRVYLQQVVENALQQTQRVRALMKQISDAHEGDIVPSARKAGWEPRPTPAGDGRAPGVMFSSTSGQKPLT